MSSLVNNLIKIIILYLSWITISLFCHLLTASLPLINKVEITHSLFLLLTISLFYIAPKIPPINNQKGSFFKRNKSFNVTAIMVSFCFILTFSLSIIVHSKIDGATLVSTQLGHFKWFFLLLAPITEELFFRGLLFRQFDQLGLNFLISTSLFTIYHFEADIEHLISLFIIGSFLYLLVLFTHSLAPSIIAHYILVNDFPLAHTSFMFVSVLIIMFILLQGKEIAKG